MDLQVPQFCITPIHGAVYEGFNEKGCPDIAPDYYAAP